MTIKELSEMEVKYRCFSCKPFSKKYKIGTIFDEEKSVRWNREEVERRNLLHEEEVKRLNNEKNKLREELIAEIKKHIIERIGKNTKNVNLKANRIYNYLYSKHYAFGFSEIINNMDDLLELIKSIK